MPDRNFWRATLLVAAAAVHFPSFAEEGPAEPQDFPDEIIVRGMSPAALRAEIERAEDNLYAIFNSLNSSDEFDIHCRLEATTGTRMKHRVCLPNFIPAAMEDAAQAFIRGAQGGAYDTSTQLYTSRMYVREQQMRVEMKELATENPRLLEAMAEVARLRQAEAQPPSRK